MKRYLIIGYGAVSYLAFVLAFVYLIGFVANIMVPRGVDHAITAPIWQAVAVDVALVALFGVQHSVMARQGFKAVWTKIVPKAVERSTYVLASSAALLLLFWKWEPIGGVIWDEPSLTSLLQGLSLAGFLIVLVSSFLINHFDLFGLRQVFLYLRGMPYTPVPFATRGWYAYVRHPLYLGFLIAFWATPRMTIAHLVFAAATTGYILIAIQLEERDMVRAVGPQYEEYREQVSMLIPRARKKPSRAGPASSLTQPR